MFIIIDCFLDRLFKSSANLNGHIPVTVAVAMTEQILAEPVPMEAHDK